MHSTDTRVLQACMLSCRILRRINDLYGSLEKSSTSASKSWRQQTTHNSQPPFLQHLPMFVKSVIFLAALAAAVSGSPTSAKRDDVSIDVVIEGTHTGDGQPIFPLLEPPVYSRGLLLVGTFYAPGLGACGKTNKPSDHIVAIGHNLFDNFPYAASTCPFAND